MEVSIDVDTSRLQNYLEKTSTSLGDIMDVAGEQLYEFLVEYHANIDWKEGRWFPGAKSGQFQGEVVRGWKRPRHTGNTVRIENTFGLLKWKTTGGIITPRRATHLTIPLLSESRGMLVSEYRAAGGSQLFRVGQALCKKVGKRVEAVYALSLGVKQLPYPDAMPPTSELAKITQRAAREFLRGIR